MRGAAALGVLGLVLLSLVLTAPASASERHPTLQELETEIICPVCPGETLDQSDAPVARRMKQFIQTRIDDGDTRREIKAKLVAQFGPGVLASPPKKGLDLLVWVLPLVGLVAGALVLGLLARRWSGKSEPEQVPGASPGANGRVSLEPELERRLEEELARFDG
jgi:cytochrome c-type biogenesis protein CcmH